MSDRTFAILIIIVVVSIVGVLATEGTARRQGCRNLLALANDGADTVLVLSARPTCAHVLNDGGRPLAPPAQQMDR